MILYSTRLYMTVLIILRAIDNIREKGKPELSLLENGYIRISHLCKTLAYLQKSTIEDEIKLTNSTKIMLMHKGLFFIYPLDPKKRIIRIKNAVVKWYVFVKPTEDTSSDKPEEMYLWFPNNETLMKIDENQTSINDSIVRNRRHNSMVPRHMIDASLDQDMIRMFNWFVINESLVQIYDNMTNRYRRSTFNDDSVKTYPLKESVYKDNVNAKTSSVIENLKAISQDEEEDDDDIPYDIYSLNWYRVNETFIEIQRPNIDVSKETKIVIHGFQAQGEDAITFSIALAFYKLKNYNVLLVNSPKTLSEMYFKSVNNARLLGKAISDMIIHLERFHANAEDFHLVGVSLGAHVAGWAGKYFRLSEGRQIGRITGLDPAGPCFANEPVEERLDKTDALYVDVIHTNDLLEGLFQPVGHADFYVNGGGPIQPGCFLVTCSHIFAAKLFAESIKYPELFVSIKCDRWSQFQANRCSNVTALAGYRSSPDTRGLYFLRTSSESPYGLGLEGITADFLNENLILV